MAVRCAQFDEADRRASRVQRMDDVTGFRRRIQPVGVEADQAEPRRRAREGVRQPSAMLFRQIEIIHRAGDVEVGIGVEPPGEPAALITQIAFDLKIRIEAEALRARAAIGAILQAAAELLRQPLLRQIGDMRRHARHGQTGRRAGLPVS